MKNKKGLATIVTLFLMAYLYLGSAVLLNLTFVVMPLTSVCLWHIPAWEAAKKANCEKAYQSGNMNCGYQK